MYYLGTSEKELKSDKQLLFEKVMEIEELKSALKKKEG